MNSIIIPGKVKTPTFDERLHRYTIASRVVPSVSQILQPLAAMAYGGIAAQVLFNAARLGTAVHACTECLDEGELDEDSVAPSWVSYVNAYCAWKESVQPEIIAIELRLACSKFGGTIDRIVKIDGQLWIIDLKTTSQIHKHVGAQLAAYAALAERHLKTTGFRRAAAPPRRHLQSPGVLVNHRRNVLQRPPGYSLLEQINKMTTEMKTQNLTYKIPAADDLQIKAVSAKNTATMVCVIVDQESFELAKNEINL